MPKRKAGDDDKGAPNRQVRYKVTDQPKYAIDPVKIIVGQGEESKTFVAFEYCLTRHSEFFNAALSGEWKENQEKEIKLAEDCPDVFEVFNRFIMDGRIYSSREDDYTSTLPGSIPRKDTEWRFLTDAWAFGQKILSTSFKDALVDAGLGKVAAEGLYPTSLASSVYPVSDLSSGIRKLAVDIAVWVFEQAELNNHVNEKCICQFFVDVAIATRTRYEKKLKNPFTAKKRDVCRYHEHVAEGKPCWQTLFSK